MRAEAAAADAALSPARPGGRYRWRICAMLLAATTISYIDRQVLGVLGVIGPSRMAYERVIPVVEATAAVLGAALDAAS